MALHALSPLDGRYENDTSALRDFFSEYAYIRGRVQIELSFLSALSETGLIPAAFLTGWTPEGSGFTEQDARKIQQYEKTTRHDVKAIEYFLRERLPSGLHPWIHFGLTSEDVNNLAQALALRESRDGVLLPALDRLLQALGDFAKEHRALPMLGRTHGQPAVPTTLGKEIAVFIARLQKCRLAMASHRFEGKLTGAIGNFNAMQSTAPQVDWISFSEQFVRSLGLQPNLVTTQILPYDNWLHYFDLLRTVNTILIDYTQDIWQYVGAGLLKQKAVEGEVGSSTMPQKVNPIDFENAEGNLGLANALLTHFSQKLAVSRLQRDLSDSTARRSFGVALGHTLLAWNNITRGMSRLDADEQKIMQELNAHWEVVSEGAQTILRAAGFSDAYESLKSQTRGQVLDERIYRHWIHSLQVDDETRERLRRLSPESYIGLAIELTDRVLRDSNIAPGISE
jgi:adenylosuccinate lyase